MENWFEKMHVYKNVHLLQLIKEQNIDYILSYHFYVMPEVDVTS